MFYREFLPPPRLSPFVECYWVLDGYDAPAPAHPERILPDGCIELIVNLGDRFREQLAGGGSSVQPRLLVAGQMTRPVFVMPTGAVRLFGVRFTPGGSSPFLEGPASELTNRIVALDDMTPTLDRELRGRLDPDAPCEDLVAVTSAILVERLHRVEIDRSPVRSAVARILRSGGKTSLDRMADDLGISGRQLERRFVNEVGLGPKLLCRILRFQQVFRVVEEADARWAVIAADCGYYDQSHLIRDFRQFTGDTPAGLLEAFSPFGEFFTRKHRTSDLSNTA